VCEPAVADISVLDLRAGMEHGGELDPVVEHVRIGGLVAHPTETVYGFGGLATAAGVATLRRLKRRPKERSFLILLPSVDAVPDLAWTEDARELASVFWPGALTLVLADPSGSFPPGIRSATGGVAVRVTSHPVTRMLVERLGVPLTSTSANAPEAPSATTGEDALAVARAAGAGEDIWVLDAGRLSPSAPSTVVDCTGATPVVLRAGATPVHRLRCVLPGIHGER
jgi:L-threonylcarbamoyladenylate synthase